MIVAQITTVHRRNDTRIWVKEVASLGQALKGVDVVLLVQDGKGSAAPDASGVRVIDVGCPGRNRLLRMLRGSWRMWRNLRALGPRVVHFHDPELMPLGLALKAAGMKVVYDVHEDVPRQILSKEWIPLLVRRPVAAAVEAMEWLGARAFDAIVPATPPIAARFPAEKRVTVQNFPISAELTALDPTPYSQRPRAFAYVGDITDSRGVWEAVEALGLLQDDDCLLELAGGCGSEPLWRRLQASEGWSRVRYHGWASRPDVARMLGRVRAGVVLLHPEPNYMEAYPNKMFEYMAAGLPVIASDFPLWREIVEGVGAGLLADPQDPAAIANRMQWLLDHPKEAEEMGRRGQRAVAERFNWQQEKLKLLSLYERLLELDPVTGTEDLRPVTTASERSRDHICVRKKAVGR